MKLQSSNPVLNDSATFEQYYGGMTGRGAGDTAAAAERDVTTIHGVVNKTGLLVLIATGAGIGGYALAQINPSIMWISGIASFIIVLGMAFLLRGKPQLSPIVAPIYAVVEGVFLGAVTSMADTILAQRGLSVAGGVGAQAFVITFAVMLAMLGLYKARILQPTRKFVAVVMTLTAGIMIAYFVSFVLSFVWKPLPLISFASAVNDQGMMGFLGLGINLFILLIASLFLIIDFGLVEQQAKAGAPKYMEWYCGFALLVTLAWIYLEAVKLVVRLAVLFGGRE